MSVNPNVIAADMYLVLLALAVGLAFGSGWALIPLGLGLAWAVAACLLDD